MTAGIEPQSTNTVLTIRPVRFQFNPQTAASNKYQSSAPMNSPDAEQQAGLAEFDGLIAALRSAGVRVLTVDDTPEPHTPDSVFPNNWISTHADGTVVLYPMEAPNRRLERRADIVALFDGEFGFQVSAVVDLSPPERRNCFLEGTGSLVFDRTNRIVYAARSSRTNKALLARCARVLHYDVIEFTATDNNGDAIYHTNVMMSVGTRLSIVCLESIADLSERRDVESRLAGSGHEIIEISRAQVGQFAGNMLELLDENGRGLLAMSAQARSALSGAQIDAIERYCRIVSAPIDTIEKLAGGSVRCMLAEIHLPSATTGARAPGAGAKDW